MPSEEVVTTAKPVDGEDSQVSCFTLVSIIMQKKNWLHCLNYRCDIVCLQEAGHFSSLRMAEGYILNSDRNYLRIWSAIKLITLKNTSRCQIIESRLPKKQIFIINVHLSNGAAQRKSELLELKAEVDHLKNSYDNPNIVCVGDFNESSAKLESLDLTFRSLVNRHGARISRLHTQARLITC